MNCLAAASRLTNAAGTGWIPAGIHPVPAALVSLEAAAKQFILLQHTDVVALFAQDGSAFQTAQSAAYDDDIVLTHVPVCFFGRYKSYSRYICH